MLVIDLRRLEKAHAEVKGEISGDDPLWAGAGLELAGPLAVEATADGSSTRGVWIRGSFFGRVRTQCRRCLNQLEMDVAEDFDLYFDPEASESDEDMTLYALDPRAEELDLHTPVSERFLLTVPAFPVCREGCSGLCPRCGANWNDVECGCPTQEPDDRWGPLQALKSDRQSDDREENVQEERG